MNDTEKLELPNWMPVYPKKDAEILLDRIVKIEHTLDDAVKNIKSMWTEINELKNENYKRDKAEGKCW